MNNGAEKDDNGNKAVGGRVMLIPFTRYEAFDPDNGAGDDRWTEWVTGTAWQFRPGVLLKAEYRRFGGSAGNPAVTEDYNEWATAFTMVF